MNAYTQRLGQGFYLPAARGWRAWGPVLAALAALGLLLAFHQVVRGAVQQGELRRTATAAHAVATWRCGTLANAATRASCLAELAAMPRGFEAAVAGGTARDGL